MIKENFADLLADTRDKVRVGKMVNTTMFMKTKNFRFVDFFNYLGTCYQKGVKVYSCSVQKSLLPYLCFDSPEKLKCLKLPDYPAWYTRLNG